jgi:SpoIID/LytB domain protein
VKAQAVAARSYAVKNMGKHNSSGYDLCDEVCCQYYQGRDKEGDSGWVRAVDVTRGEVVLYGDQVANTQYSASCGGHTDNNEEVWGGTPLPYLRGVPCLCSQDPANPYAHWTVTYTREQMEALLNAHADSYVGTLYSMDLSDRTSSGRVRRATFVGSAGAKTISGEKMRFYLGLRSSMVNVVPDRFDEYLLLANPGSQTVQARVDLYCSSGETAEVPVEVPPMGRRTLHVDDYFNRKEVSALVRGDGPLVAERAMYFNYLGFYDGGSCGHGTCTPSREWYLAEGYTAQKFDTWILFFNPGEEEATARVRLLREDGHRREVEVKVPARGRASLWVDQLEDFSSCSFSAAINSDREVVVERAMYFEYYGKKGGHVAEAAPVTSNSWYFAEGYTAEDFDTWILVGNPEDRHARVTFRLCTPGGQEKRVEALVEPGSRYTLKVDDYLPSSEVSVFVESDVPLVAERSMYFSYRGWDDGSCALGVTQAGPRWYFAEGYTAEDFDTWILVGNPGGEEADVKVSLLTRGGLARELRYRIMPHSRFTLKVDDIIPADEVSAVVEEVSGKPIVAERAVYFNYRGRTGGHASQGVPEPADAWYFAEGYTGS